MQQVSLCPYIRGDTVPSSETSTPVYQVVSYEEIFYTEDGSNWFLPPKILYLDSKLRGVTSEKTVMVVVMSMVISNLTLSPLGGEQACLQKLIVLSYSRNFRETRSSPKSPLLVHILSQMNLIQTYSALFILVPV